MRFLFQLIALVQEAVNNEGCFVGSSLLYGFSNLQHQKQFPWTGIKNPKPTTHIPLINKPLLSNDDLRKNLQRV